VGKPTMRKSRNQPECPSESKDLPATTADGEPDSGQKTPETPSHPPRGLLAAAGLLADSEEWEAIMEEVMASRRR
jgi:hypothetical protein